MKLKFWIHLFNKLCQPCLVSIYKSYHSIISIPRIWLSFFFMASLLGGNIGFEWTDTWTWSPTDRKENIFWPKRWLLDDIGNNVQTFSFSYDTNIFGVHNDVTKIGKPLLQILVVNPRYNNVLHWIWIFFQDLDKTLFKKYIHWNLKMTYKILESCFWNTS
jgi:hypothetical protein